MPTYISAEGLENLKKEFVERKKFTRREIAERISVAKDLGDLSENFEYHEAKEQQGLNEARMLQLDAMIKDAVLVEEKTGATVITIGATFVAQLDGKEKTFQIVGSSEANPLEGKISNESPIGQAFIGHTVNEEIEVTVPSGILKYIIKSIK